MLYYVILIYPQIYRCFAKRWILFMEGKKSNIKYRRISLTFLYIFFSDNCIMVTFFFPLLSLTTLLEFPVAFALCMWSLLLEQDFRGVLPAHHLAVSACFKWGLSLQTCSSLHYRRVWKEDINRCVENQAAWRSKGIV